MKRILLVLMLVSSGVSAQVNFPELSPQSILNQTVGHTTFEIRYGRPAARQREIMGELVPYDRLWRTGAGKGTTISFDSAVVINGRTIPPGIYAFVTIPGAHEWTVLLNSDTSRIYGHPSEYDVSNEVVRLSAKPEKTNRFYESLSIDVDIIRYDAIVYVSWEHTQIHFKVSTGAHEKTVAEIKAAMERNPGDAALLAEASYYYSMNNLDYEQVLQWLDEAILLGGDRWVYHQKVDVLEKLRRYEEARKAAASSIAFLQRTKPVEWSDEIEILETRMRSWPKR